MWNFGIGPIELAVLAALALLVVFVRGLGKRWLLAMLAAVAIGVFLTPADPLSAAIVAIPLIVAFICGVYAGPFIQQTNGAVES